MRLRAAGENSGPALVAAAAAAAASQPAFATFSRVVGTSFCMVAIILFFTDNHIAGAVIIAALAGATGLEVRVGGGSWRIGHETQRGVGEGKAAVHDSDGNESIVQPAPETRRKSNIQTAQPKRPPRLPP